MMWAKHKITVPMGTMPAENVWAELSVSVAGEMSRLRREGWEADPKTLHVEVGVDGGGECVFFVTFETSR